MWETWLFWILFGGLILYMMFRHGGCGSHAGHGGSQGPAGSHAGHGDPGKEGTESDINRNHAHGGCH